MSVYLGSNKIGNSIYKNFNRFIKIISGELEELKQEDFYDLKEIAEYKFYCVQKLKKVELSNSILKINSFAFGNNENLEEISISKSVDEIGNYAFANCPNLKKVFLYSTVPPKIYYNSFDTTWGGILRDDFLIYIPSGTIETYKNADVWYNYADRFVEMGE